MTVRSGAPKATSKIIIGSDVDPIFPPLLRGTPQEGAWSCLDDVQRLVESAGSLLPPITWLIRADQSVKFTTGAWDSGYTTKSALWNSLQAKGHELGWHMHLITFDPVQSSFEFDPDPGWLAEAHSALAAHFEVRATRTGWDYASNILFQRLNGLGIVVDFSALPGNLAWHPAGHGKIAVDWSRCPDVPYHPGGWDYQKSGELAILEIPITQFPNPLRARAKRLAWRLLNGSLELRGLGCKTRFLTEPWDELPPLSDISAFYFHPEDLAGTGLDNMLENLKLLRNAPETEFITASEAAAVIGQTEKNYPASVSCRTFVQEA